MPHHVKPRLLVVCRSFGEVSEVWIARQIKNFTEFEVAVLCWNVAEGIQEYPDIPIYSLHADFDKDEQSVKRWYSRLRLLPDGNLRGTTGKEKKRLIEITRQFAPNVVLCHFGHTALRYLPAAKALHLPLVVHFHGLDLSSSLRDRYYKWSLKHSCGRFGEAVVVGTHQKSMLVKLGMSPDRISLLPCGAPVDEFTPKMDYHAATCKFIAVSRLVPWKGLDFTIRAFAAAQKHHANMELHIVGSGPMEASLRKLVAAENLQSVVTFHGQQSSQQVHRLLLDSDVFVQHSLDDESGWREGFGVSITEASVCGLPVIVTDCGGIHDQIVNDDNGLMVPQRDWEAMSFQMLRLARNQELRERLGRSGRQRAERYFDSAKLAARLQQRLLQVALRRDRPIAATPLRELLAQPIIRK